VQTPCRINTDAMVRARARGRLGIDNNAPGEARVCQSDDARPPIRSGPRGNSPETDDEPHHDCARICLVAARSREGL
jgi:hypothetical protein